MYKGRKVAVVIAAGGAGRRFGADEPKQFMSIGGRSMLVSAAVPFLGLSCVDEIVFVVPEDFAEQCRVLLESELGAVRIGGGSGMSFEDVRGSGAVLRAAAGGGREVPLRIIAGGADRAASVRSGLDALAAGGGKNEDGAADGLVLIHDAARPFVTADLIERALDAAYTFGAAVPAIPVSDTVYAAGVSGFAGEAVKGAAGEVCFAEEIPDRSRLRAVQTPQGFDFALIKNAHEWALSESLAVTDDGTPVFASGGRVALVEGDPANIKITLPGDIPEQAARMSRFGCGEEFLRVGIGFDAHRFAEGRALILGGVEIPFEKGLAGHSDADVLTHALMDAILGALCAGDIGKLFPDTDPAYAGISSMVLLSDVVSLMRSREYETVNADMTLVAERPRMAAHCAAIEKSLAAALGTAPENISLKATTTEKLGFTGREEGMAAEAVILIKKTQANTQANIAKKNG